MDEKQDNLKENVTMYGEFVCSEHKWLPIDEQKANAKRLAIITEKTIVNGKTDK